MNNQRRKTKTPKSHERRRSSRARFVGVILILCLIGLFIRTWYIYEARGDDLLRLAVRQEALTTALRQTGVPAARGHITDRNFMDIALSRPVYTVFVDVIHAADRRNPTNRNLLNETVEALHEAFGIPVHELEAIFARDADGNLINSTHYHVIARDVPASIAIPLRDNRELRDVHANEYTFRWYEDPFFAPHVIGFRRGGALHGLELQYNALLTGEAGRVFRTFDTHGNPRVETEDVRHGYTLVTTLDADIQRLAQRIVDDTFRNIPSRQVGLLVKNPHTGEILAMAQAPSFSLADPGDPTYFTDPGLRANWDAISEEERVNRMLNMWSNFHLTHTFEPGSIFKPFVMAAALEEGVVTVNCSFFCGGYINVADSTVRCWLPAGHGNINISEAMYRSCNVAMAEINHRLGRDAFYRYRGYFGFGERTGIDLPGEADVSSPAVMYGLHQLGPVQLATSSIGQGFNSTTIQSITAFSSLINGGYLMQPFLVSQIVDNDNIVVYENLPTVVRSTVSAQTANFMRNDMQNVVSAEHGTGWRSAIPGFAIGGKTGTAQQGRGDNLTGITLSYIAYTPVHNPEFIVLMTIDHVEDRSMSSGVHVAPIVRGFFEELIQIRNLRPSEGPYVDNWQAMHTGGHVMPDFSGDRLLDVVRNLNNMGDDGLDFLISGTGTVITHHVPAPGMPMPQTGMVILYLDPDTVVDDMVLVPHVMGLPVAQAESVLLDLQLTAVLATGRQNDFDPNDFTPGTAQAEERDNSSGEASPYSIAGQFPAPGTMVERGFQVRLVAGR